MSYYLAFRSELYEGDFFLGIFSTRELADAACEADRASLTYSDDDVSYSVLLRRVDERESERLATPCED